MKVLATQLCLTLCNIMDCSPPGSSVHKILQARTQKWIAILFSRDLPDLVMEPGLPTLQVDYLPSEPPWKPMDVHNLKFLIKVLVIKKGSIYENSPSCALMIYAVF